jgi:hypothetical protein
MKNILLSAALVMGLAGTAAAEATYTLGSTVPANVSFTDQNGVARTIGDYRGKVVVLEWTNKGCPFVHKFYDSGTMQAMQANAVKQGVAWISVISSAEGKEGYLAPDTAAAEVSKTGFKGTGVALDAKGSLGRAFGATNTPTIAILDTTGKQVYFGAVDNIPSFNKDDIASATNYVNAALAEVLAGKEVTTPSTKPYGCSIKY